MTIVHWSQTVEFMLLNVSAVHGKVSTTGSTAQYSEDTKQERRSKCTTQNLLRPESWATHPARTKMELRLMACSDRGMLACRSLFSDIAGRGDGFWSPKDTIIDYFARIVMFYAYEASIAGLYEDRQIFEKQRRPARS